MGIGVCLSSLRFTPLSLPLSESPEPFACFPEGLAKTNSLTRLFAARIACLVPIIVPLVGLPLPPTVARGNAVFPEGGRLAFLVAGATRDLVDELRALELLADNVRVLFALTGICLVLRLPLTSSLFTVVTGFIQDGGEVAIEEEVTTGDPNLPTDLLDLLLRLAPLFSRLSAGFDPKDDKLSHLSRDIWLP